LDIIEETENNTYRIIFTDNGCGIDEGTVKRVVDPFFTTRTVRKIGLGLPLLKQNCEQTGGSLIITSKLSMITSTVPHWAMLPELILFFFS
jgi:signal transduction histidine kinase